MYMMLCMYGNSKCINNVRNPQTKNTREVTNAKKGTVIERDKMSPKQGLTRSLGLIQRLN